MQVFSLRPKQATVSVADPQTFTLKKPVVAGKPVLLKPSKADLDKFRFKPKDNVQYKSMYGKRIDTIKKCVMSISGGSCGYPTYVMTNGDEVSERDVISIVETSVTGGKKPVTAMNREDVLQSIKYAILNYPGMSLEDDDIDLLSKAADGKVLTSTVTIAIKIKTPAQAKNFTTLMRMIDTNEQALDVNAVVSYPKAYKDYAVIKIQKNMDRLAELFGVDDVETSALDKSAVEEKIKDVLDGHNVFSHFSWQGDEFVIPVGEENFKNKKLVADLEAQSGDGYTLRVCAKP